MPSSKQFSMSEPAGMCVDGSLSLLKFGCPTLSLIKKPSCQLAPSLSRCAAFALDLPSLGPGTVGLEVVCGGLVSFLPAAIGSSNRSPSRRS